MGFAQWMRVLETIGGLVQLTGRMRRPPDVEGPTGLQTSGGGPLGQLETRLAGVVVAALKEAFDRDSARLELERSHIEAERRRAEEALRAELRRQAADRLLAQLKLVAVMAIGMLGLSAALMVWLPGMRDGLPRGLLAAGWLFAIAALGYRLRRLAADLRLDRGLAEHRRRHPRIRPRTSRSLAVHRCLGVDGREPVGGALMHVAPRTSHVSTSHFARQHVRT